MKLSRIDCPECGELLIRTSERWMVCPNGHGGLYPAPYPNTEKARNDERTFAKKVDEAARAYYGA